MLLSRYYPARLIDSALNRATSILRKLALKSSKKKKYTMKIPVFAIKYDPRLPSIQTIQAKHWRSMVSQHQYLAECITEPILTAIRKPTNLRELLIKARVPPPPNQRPDRKIKGMKKCGKGCFI